MMMLIEISADHRQAFLCVLTDCQKSSIVFVIGGMLRFVDRALAKGRFDMSYRRLLDDSCMSCSHSVQIKSESMTVGGLGKVS